ncbi:hypothetical protein Tco_0913006 [Tanacetum coccineum]
MGGSEEGYVGFGRKGVVVVWGLDGMDSEVLSYCSVSDGQKQFLAYIQLGARPEPAPEQTRMLRARVVCSSGKHLLSGPTHTSGGGSIVLSLMSRAIFTAKICRLGLSGR